MSKVQVTGEIFQVGGGPLSSPEDAAIYLINFNGHAALIDAGSGRETDRLLANIRSCGVNLNQIEYILLTHCHFDHTGGVPELKSRLGCSIVAHELDAGFLERGDSEARAADWYGSFSEPFSIDRKLRGEKEEIELGWRIVRAVHVPGHSPGSVVYLVESEGHLVVFAQDVHEPLHPSFHSNREDYIRSLKLMIALNADILCEGHYGIHRGKRKVAAFIGEFLKEC